MEEKRNYKKPSPMVNIKEQASLDLLTVRYQKMTEPSKIAKIGKKAGELIPDKLKQLGKDLGFTITEQDLYAKIMELVSKGFSTIEEYAAKFTISEKQILVKINKYSNQKIRTLDEICLVRSYDIAKVVNSYKGQDILGAAVEGAGTGALGFAGLPFNIVLSTFLYFRAVQTIAMFYGYDVKNDSAEMVIASEVFTQALSPTTNDVNNEMTTTIGKIMVMSQAAAVKQTVGKSWTEMAARGGIPLLITQMRALAHAAAKKALNNAGKKGLENSLFKEAFEQIGKKLTQKAVSKGVPYFSAAFSALIDVAQMKQVLDYADIFYQKRFVMEKANRITLLLDEAEEIIDAEEILEADVIDIDEISEVFGI